MRKQYYYYLVSYVPRGSMNCSMLYLRHKIRAPECIRGTKSCFGENEQLQTHCPHKHHAARLIFLVTNLHKSSAKNMG